MSKNYTQLSLEQRYQIEALLKAGTKQKIIAELIGVHASTISREILRNAPVRGWCAGQYRARNAQNKTDTRHKSKPKVVVFTADIKQRIKQRMEHDKWSPELISYHARKQGEVMVSHEWIYRWIWECKHQRNTQTKPYKQLWKHLRHAKRRNKRGNRQDRRGLIPNRTPIELRPVIVSKRKRVGDIEVDLMVGKDQKGILLVMVDRATLHTRLQRLERKDAAQVAIKAIQCLKCNPYRPRTLTFDNDMTFSRHEQIGKATGAQTYFTRPYTSQDKGTVENRIGTIRRFFPKKTDLRAITDQKVQQVEDQINNRPIRKFNYLTANQVLQKKLHL